MSGVQSKVKKIKRSYLERVEMARTSRVNFYNVLVADLKQMRHEVEEIEARMVADLIPVVTNPDIRRRNAKYYVRIRWYKRKGCLQLEGPYWITVSSDGSERVSEKRVTARQLERMVDSDAYKVALDAAKEITQLTKKRNRLKGYIDSAVNQLRLLPAWVNELDEVEDTEFCFPRANTTVFNAAAKRKNIMMQASYSLFSVIDQITPIEQSIDEQIKVINACGKRRHNALAAFWDFTDSANSSTGLLGPYYYQMRFGAMNKRHLSRLKAINRDVIRNSYQRKYEKTLLGAASKIQVLAKKRNEWLEPIKKASAYILAGKKLIDKWS